VQLSPDGRTIHTEVDSVLAKDVGEGLGHGRLLTWNQAWRLLDDRDACTESRQGLRDLASHRSTPEDQRRTGEIRRCVDLLARPDQRSVQPLDLGDLGDAADRDDQIGPADGVPVDIQSSGTYDASAPAVHDDSLGTKLRDPAGIIQAVRDLVASARRDTSCPTQPREPRVIPTEYFLRRRDRLSVIHHAFLCDLRWLGTAATLARPMPRWDVDMEKL
jgi:hypothetical protein